MNKTKVIFLLLLWLLLAGCSSSRSFLLLKTKYNTFDFEDNKQNTMLLKQICRDAQLTFKTENFEGESESEETLNRIYSILETPGIKYVVIDPLLGVSMDLIVPKYPLLGFISYKKNENFHYANLLQVKFNKEDAFKKAARISVLLLKQKNPVLLEKQAPGEKLKLGIIHYIFLPEQTAEINLFRDEFVNAYSAEELIIEEVRNVNDRNDINNKIDKLIRNGAVLIFPRLYIANSYCLDIIAKKGSIAIIENWNFFHTEIDKSILFSINDNFIDSVQMLLKLKTVTEEKTVSWETPVVNVNSQITWGPVIKIPGEAAQILSDNIQQ